MGPGARRLSLKDRFWRERQRGRNGERGRVTLGLKEIIRDLIIINRFPQALTQSL